MGSHGTAETYYRIGRVEQRWDYENIINSHLKALCLVDFCGRRAGVKDYAHALITTYPLH